jgi:hypothetical protein
MLRHFGAATALCLVSSLAIAQSKPDEAKFTLHPNPAFLSCLSGSSTAPRASVVVRRGELNDTALLRVSGLKPNLAFDVFTVQRRVHSTAAARQRPASRALAWLGISPICMPTIMATPRW